MISCRCKNIYYYYKKGARLRIRSPLSSTYLFISVLSVSSSCRLWECNVNELIISINCPIPCLDFGIVGMIGQNVSSVMLMIVTGLSVNNYSYLVVVNSWWWMATGKHGWLSTSIYIYILVYCNFNTETSNHCHSMH